MAFEIKKSDGIYYYDEKKEKLIEHYGKCPVCGEAFDGREPVKLHHVLHNTEGNRNKYPFFIQSLANLHPAHNKCQDGENVVKMKESEAVFYETFYRAWWDLVRAVPCDYILTLGELKHIATIAEHYKIRRKG